MAELHFSQASIVLQNPVYTFFHLQQFPQMAAFNHVQYGIPSYKSIILCNPTVNAF